MRTKGEDDLDIRDAGLGGIWGRYGKQTACILLAVVGLMLLWASVATVGSGSVGVLTLFGRVTGEVLPEGIHLVNPFKANHEMTVRTQEIKETADVPSQEGLIISMDVSLLMRLASAKAADVYQKVGPDYAEVIVKPSLRSAIREVTAGNTASALWSTARESLAEQIRSQLSSTVEPRGIMLERILLRDVRPPATVRQAIEAKQQADQEAQRMVYVLQKERQEADRKRIEAQGIADFQKIVTQGISEPLLVWKGIEATETLAKSPNTKVIVIGNTRNGLPLILEPGGVP